MQRRNPVVPDPAILNAIESHSLLVSGGVIAVRPGRSVDGRVRPGHDGRRQWPGRRGGVRTVARNTSTPSWAPAWSRPATRMSCRCRPSSSPPRMGRRSRTANATPPGAGWPGTVRRSLTRVRSSSATICPPASRRHIRPSPNTSRRQTGRASRNHAYLRASRCAGLAPDRHRTWATYRFFEHLRTITTYVVFADWSHLLRSIAASAIRPP